MLHNLTGWHALIVLAILLLVFGSTKLPSLAKGVGQSLRILKDEVREETPSSPRDTTVPYRHAS
ncbi:twin-arginine translocase TatA/TatE family subunit [Nocardia sp. NPDC059177]|uniref:twin-arginine translocase TatA/TatE family subunit n=1 Tax=Nocardia sp. NPDC059177 TaxID=3346759 RepID=UPI0036737E71